ncbi:Hypothetical predicted protein [Pelobates cultripes]|uniref:Uncharacterized protein n=1 Tax=Pelobates cultripes TaxID=61616 RepID=A0AAD1T285_PELCU|nr:Hypothetical predicted protein [Pelobates cultripes]
MLINPQLERRDVQDVPTGTGSDAQYRKEEVERTHGPVEHKPEKPARIYTGNYTCQLVLSTDPMETGPPLCPPMKAL